MVWAKRRRVAVILKAPSTPEKQPTAEQNGAVPPALTRWGG